MKRLVPLAVATLAVSACQDASGPAPQLSPIAPQVVNAAKGVPIPGDYIITLRSDLGDVTAIAQSISGLHKGALKHVYKSALKGFAVKNISEAAAAAIASDPRVQSVEADQVMTAITTQTGATWGIDRIDQRALPLSTTYDFTADGTGVIAYIIDTGINFDHTDFGGRANKGIDQVTSGGTAADCNGHGTHVSGTVGGANYGVAKNVSLVAVRVLDCAGSGTTSGVIAGVDWVTSDHAANAKPAVANMSLGGGASTALDNAVANSIAAGVTYAIAAGNGNFLGIAQNACNSSPARVGPAITVSATDATDTKASWANYGACVDIFGPGVSITSDWYTSNTATNTISGTSMATPHVAGAAALYLQNNPGAAPEAVATALRNNATPGAVKNGGSGSPNFLLYTGTADVPPPPPPPPAPVAQIASHTCSGRTCSFTAVTDSRITSYSWNFGDGTTGSGSSVSRKYARATGSYTVTLTTQPGSSTATTQVNCTSGSGGTTCQSP